MNPPKSGEPVVVDANVLADFLLSEAVPTFDSDRARAARRLVTRCCVVVYSSALSKEIPAAVHKRGVPFPRNAVVSWRDLVADKDKYRHVGTSALNAVSFDSELERRLPPEDVHLGRLSLAARAVVVVTHDEALLNSGRDADVTKAMSIVDPGWILEHVPRES
jgi:predicted nucleic acid-binding protein